MNAMLQFDLITIFPNIFDSYLKESILRRAAEKKLVRFAVHNLRDFAEGKHKVVDNPPYGGGAGMVLKVGPIFRAVQALQKKKKTAKTRVVLLSAKGRPFTQAVAKKYARLDRLIFICGRYEGVDERVARHIADDELSVGPYVLTGGELPALTICDAVTRLVPGVLGNKESLSEESFGFGQPLIHNPQSAIAAVPREYPHYTRPEVFEPRKGVKWKVPPVLTSGDHKKIEAWRKKQMQ